METLGQRIQHKREELNLKKVELAARMHPTVHPSMINKYEDDSKIPKSAQLYSIAQALGVSMDWLYSGEGEGNRYSEMDSLYNSLPFKEQETLLGFARYLHKEARKTLYSQEGGTKP